MTEPAVACMDDATPWLDIARGERGVHEVRGGENPRILEYHATTTLRAQEDEVPWCSAFVNWCLKQVGIQGTDSARAASWIGWGYECRPWRPGAIVVVYHVGGPVGMTSSGNHVGFLLEEVSRKGWRILGGNQGDAVCERWFADDRWQLRAIRWPDP